MDKHPTRDRVDAGGDQGVCERRGCPITQFASAPVNPAVSVIIPTYNRANFVRQTLHSVLAQTFCDLEVIVVDDGSTDETIRVVSDIKDPRVRYVQQPHSGLPASSRNRGIQMAQGDFIAFLDSDDLWLPGKLGLQIPWMKAHRGIGLTCTNAVAFDEADQLWRLNKAIFAQRRTLRDLLCGNFIATLTVVVRRECLDHVGVFSEDPRLRAIEDYQLWLRIAARYPFAYLPQATARYRVHQGNLAAGDLTTVFIERTIEMLRAMEGTAGLSQTDLARGLAVHHRRLARAYAMSGDQAGYFSALLSSWRLRPDWKTFVLLAWYFLPGFRASRWMTARARQIKDGVDHGLWRLSRVLKGRWAH